MNAPKILRLLIKFPSFGFALFLYFIASLTIFTLCGFNFVRARKYLTKVISYTSKVGLKIIGIKVVQKIHPFNPQQNYLFVSNHLSYIDVLVISSIFPSSFVTSKEMKETFFLGHLCMLGGCLFVDRKSKKSIHKEVKELTTALNSGVNVTIFPEATTGDGAEMLRFKRPLFQAAIDANATLLPMCLNYKSIDGEAVSLKNRDTFFWYGDMTFLNHAIGLFSAKKMVVELSVFPEIKTELGHDKAILAEKCFEIIASKYKNIST